jgi:3-oxoacyl-[acyl-carrier protein] reductase
MDDLTNRVALVTGASRGIGRASAMALAAAGAKIAVNYHTSAGKADEAVAEIVTAGGTAVAIQADVSDANAAASLVRETEAELGPIDILVNNAGVIARKPVDEVGPDYWDETIRINLSSAFYVTHATLPGMRARGWGRIIFLSSIAAQTGGVIGPHYAASKAGLLGLSHSCASLFAKEGITANAIAPALIDTDMVRGNPGAKPDLIPVKRFGTADEVAAVVVLLASNGYITGQTIGVNGGWYMT